MLYFSLMWSNKKGRTFGLQVYDDFWYVLNINELST